MRVFLFVLILVVMVVFFPVAKSVASGGRCINTTIEVSPTSVASGQTMQATAHFTNCGGSNLSNVGAKAYAYREPALDCYTEIIPYTLIPNIGPGQTVNISAEFIPVCVGDWEAYSSMHPSSLWAYGEAEFTVTP